MSRTLNLADRLLGMGRTFQGLGRDRDAVHILGRLASFRQLPKEIAEETQVRLGELFLRRQRFRRARRHLTAALAHRPESARYQYLMASALAADERVDPKRAVDHYRKSLQLDPRQPRCLGELGLLALRLGQTEKGLAWLRQGAELAPDDPEAVGRLVEGLRQLDRGEEARAALRAALFRHPRDRRFQKLWQDFQFHQLCREQEAGRNAGSPAGSAGAGPVLLPFVRPAAPVVRIRTNRQTVRRDPASPPNPPHLPQPARLPGRKHAQ